MVQCTISTNLEYLLTRPGILKLMTLVFGLLGMGFGLHGIDDSSYNNYVEDPLENEEYFVSAITVTFGISIIYLTLHAFSDDLANSRVNRLIDTIYHGIAGKSLLVAGLLLIISAVHIQTLAACKTFPLFLPPKEGHHKGCQLHDYKVIGGGFAIITAILYEITAYFIYTTKELP